MSLAATFKLVGNGSSPAHSLLQSRNGNDFPLCRESVFSCLRVFRIEDERETYNRDRERQRESESVRERQKDTERDKDRDRVETETEREVEREVKRERERERAHCHCRGAENKPALTLMKRISTETWPLFPELVTGAVWRVVFPGLMYKSPEESSDAHPHPLDFQHIPRGYTGENPINGGMRLVVNV